MASAAAAAASSADWLSTADRLALLIQRYGLAEDKVAQQLGWPLEQLRAYLAPDTRVQATSDVVDNAADKLLMRYRVAMARQTLAGTASGPLAPVEASARRSVLPAAFSRAVIDRRSVIHAQPTPAQQRASTERQAAAATAAVTGGIASRRKRKRKVLAQDLSVADGPTSASTSSTAEPRKLRIRPGAVDLVCPIRLDVDADGVRYQDTFLLDASSASCTPERMASQIAIDEKLPDSVQNALAESIRRQLMTFCTSAASSFDVMPDRLYPIYLDIIIGGISLRDQIEWDITNDFPSAQSFASTLCADLNLSPAFESATTFSIWEQVVAYRTALGFRKWIGVEPSSDAQPKVNSDTTTVGAGFIDCLPPLEANTPEELDVIRHSPDIALWQPIVSELSREERTYLAAKLGATHAPTSRKNIASHDATGNHAPKRHPQHRAAPKDHKLPRPINPFIMYCQVQKDIFAKSKSRKSASETRKIFGDMWRKCTDEEKEYYAQLTEAENEKRRREYILDQRDRAIAEWEEDEARRKGLLSSALLDATPEYLRGLLLEDYVNERHEVDVNRAHASVDEDEDVDNDE